MSPIGSVGRSVRGRRLPDVIDLPDAEVVHEYRFDEGEGTDFYDSIGSADGSFTGVTWHEDAGAVGDVMAETDGVDDEGEVQSNRHQIDDVGTFVTTVEPTETVSDTLVLWAHNGTDNDNRIQLYIQEENELRIGLGEESRVAGGFSPIEAGTKHRIGVSWDTGSYEVVVNNTTEETGTYDGTIDANTVPWTWGGAGDALHSPARFDQSRLSPDAFTADDWEADYNEQPWVDS